MPRDDKRRYQPPPDIIAMLDAGLEPALVAVNHPPRGIAKVFALHFGEEIQRDLQRRLREKEDQS